MTIDQFKAAYPSNQIPQSGRVSHPIYGAGQVLRSTGRGAFHFVRFDVPRSDRMQVLAVSLNVCGAAS